MSYVSDFMASVSTKMGVGTFALPANIRWGEVWAQMSLPDSAFPRIELNIEKLGDLEYFAQRTKTESILVSVAGYVFEEDWNEDDFDSLDASQRLMDFAIETRKLVFSFHDDKIAGNSPANGFVQILATSEIVPDFLFAEGYGSFVFVFEAQFDKYDTLCS